MYEKVLVVGVSVGRSRNGQKTYIRVHTYGSDGTYRAWTNYTVPREKLNAGNLFSDTLAPLIEACSGSSCMLTDLQKHLLADDDLEVERIECRLRDASVALLEDIAASPQGTEEEISERLSAAVVGHIVRIDWEERGEYGRLAPHALAILPSKDDGAESFGGKPLSEWFTLYASYRGSRPPDARDVRRSQQLGARLMQMKVEVQTETLVVEEPVSESDESYPF